jgi:hypothetical protein
MFSQYCRRGRRRGRRDGKGEGKGSGRGGEGEEGGGMNIEQPGYSLNLFHMNIKIGDARARYETKKLPTNKNCAFLATIYSYATFSR